MELPKAYEPRDYEDKIYSREKASGFFSPDKCVENGVAEKDAPYFSMVLPPPNVTGVLHMGHAAMLAIEDLMTRYHRMKGDRTLWLPGTDHAAIATQTKVEKLLMEKGMADPRKELGREKFLEEVNKFARASHDTIVGQCEKMGSSLDWSREAFTLDEKRNLAVRTVFKKMYDDGLIERGYRIVNWCPRCQSTLADDEVEHKEQSAKIYTFKYSVDFPLSIATTRPETKLGDTAVAVNPKDKRYKKLIGKVFEVKNFGGLPGEASAKSGADLKIKIIADEAVDVNFGTGAVGVTPAHSFVDYDMAKKNDLPVIKIIGEDGKMTAEAGPAYAGLPPKEARKKVVEYLRANNLLEKEEDAPNNLSVCYRCAAPIEPLPSRQWFIKVNKEFKMGQSQINGIKEGNKTTLKKLMQAAVKGGQIKIIPDRFDKTYFHWIDNLRDWCISRQIWYGHQVPVYYCKNNCHSERSEEFIFVSIEPIDKCPRCGGAVTQDPDTLDTWFSAGLWTFSTLGWPVDNVIARSEPPKAGSDAAISSDFAHFHPTSVLETGYDILFFWVARMILMTTYTLGDIPFETVYLHGLVRDEQGRKMSKSLGNVIDPLDMVNKYGADATRMSLLLGCSPGNDSKLSEEKIAGFRNFTNKLWNICRFMIGVILSEAKDPSPSIFKDSSVDPLPQNDKMTLSDKWILKKLEDVINTTSQNIEQYNFSYAGEQLRDFTWNELADWYLEIAKIEGDKSAILKHVLDNVLKLWHPFMPFVTEAIWQEMKKENLLLIERWPGSANATPGKPASAAHATPGKPFPVILNGAKRSEESDIRNFEIIRNIITGIRSLRADYKIEPAKKLIAFISAGKFSKLLSGSADIIQGLARLENLTVKDKIEKPAGCAGFVASGVEVYIDLSGVVDFDKEKARIEKEVAEAGPYLNGLTKKLSNNEFVKNAPQEVIAKERQKLTDAEEKILKLKEQLKNLN